MQILTGKISDHISKGFDRKLLNLVRHFFRIHIVVGHFDLQVQLRQHFMANTIAVYGSLNYFKFNICVYSLWDDLTYLKVMTNSFMKTDCHFVSEQSVRSINLALGRKNCSKYLNIHCHWSEICIVYTLAYVNLSVIFGFYSISLLFVRH